MSLQAFYFIVALVHSVTNQGVDHYTVLELAPDDDWKYLRLHGYVESEFPAPDRMGKVIPTQKGRDFVNDLLRSINK